jgi:hypothetical protein
MSYKTVYSMHTTEVISIIRTDTGLTIPTDPANSDYQQYLAWVAEGNTAEEWEIEDNS